MVLALGFSTKTPNSVIMNFRKLEQSISSRILGIARLYLTGMRIMMFQLSGSYPKP